MEEREHLEQQLTAMEKRIEAAHIAKMESLKQTTDSRIMTLEKDII